MPFPSQGAGLYLYTEGEKAVTRPGRDGATAKEPRGPRPPRGFPTASLDPPPPVPAGEVGEGWKPGDRAAEAARRQFPSNACPAPPRWRAGAGKRGADRRCHGSAAAAPDAAVACGKRGPRARSGRPGGVAVTLPLRPGPHLVPGGIRGEIESPPNVARSQGRSAPLTRPPTGAG
ncbi:hypothetical protein P7K49_018446 [Saguinus oedipus]|uniref:Uncharacterized protein n=1 Tax=Saguinus oedipus TaxID=9490 RepID=A0ABQ9V612_SAGOE|nr:hypothetical protein P7K49_018446 [Saguinus oedipus]